MLWVAVVLAIFLFYKFVERRHKVITFKTLALCLLVGILGYSAFYFYEKHQSAAVNAGIRIELESAVSKVPNEQVTKECDRLLAALLSSNNSFLSPLNASDISNIKTVLYPDGYPPKFEDAFGPFDSVELRDALQLYITNYGKYENPGLQKLNSAYERLLPQAINEAQGANTKSLSDEKKVLYLFHLKRINDALTLFPDLRSKFLGGLPENDKNDLISLNQLVDEENQKVKTYLSEHGDTTLNFIVCNDRNVPLLAYSFAVSGYSPGHSTPLGLLKNDSGSTNFYSDIIVPQKSCAQMQWVGAYALWNHYEVRNIVPKFSDNP